MRSRDLNLGLLSSKSIDLQVAKPGSAQQALPVGSLWPLSRSAGVWHQGLGNTGLVKALRISLPIVNSCLSLFSESRTVWKWGGRGSVPGKLDLVKQVPDSIYGLWLLFS